MKSPIEISNMMKTLNVSHVDKTLLRAAAVLKVKQSYIMIKPSNIGFVQIHCDTVGVQ